jgi:hypothetical protein
VGRTIRRSAKKEKKKKKTEGAGLLKGWAFGTVNPSALWENTYTNTCLGIHFLWQEPFYHSTLCYLFLPPELLNTGHTVPVTTHSSPHHTPSFLIRE